MAGLFDLHTQLLLQDGWAFYAANPDEFAFLFSSVEVPEEMVAAWHEALFPGGAADAVTFRQAFRPGDDPLPIIVTQQVEEPNTNQPINYYGGVDEQGNETRTMLQSEIAVITFAVSQPELTRPMHAVIKSSMIRGVAWLDGIGYSGLDFLGGGDLQPLRELLPEDYGVYFRSQRWATKSRPVVRVAALEKKPALIGASDIISDGVRGGVTVSE